jgi:hypothetical protein
MPNSEATIKRLNRHVASALDLEERTNEAKHYCELALFDQIAAESQSWQGTILQRVLDLLANGTADLPHPIVDSRQSYLDPMPSGIAGTEGYLGMIRQALTTIGERTLLDMDLKDPNTTVVLAQVSRGASQILREVDATLAKYSL